jgi:hypothetical protein
LEVNTANDAVSWWVYNHDASIQASGTKVNRSNGYIAGNPHRMCDRCGLQRRVSTTSKEWTGLVVCRDCRDDRPAELTAPRVGPEGLPILDARPDSIIFISAGVPPGSPTIPPFYVSGGGTPPLPGAAALRFNLAANSQYVPLVIDDL